MACKNLQFWNWVLQERVKEQLLRIQQHHQNTVNVSNALMLHVCPQFLCSTAEWLRSDGNSSFTFLSYTINHLRQTIYRTPKHRYKPLQGLLGGRGISLLNKPEHLSVAEKQQVCQSMHLDVSFNSINQSILWLIHQWWCTGSSRGGTVGKAVVPSRIEKEDALRSLGHSWSSQLLSAQIFGLISFAAARFFFHVLVECFEIRLILPLVFKMCQQVLLSGPNL